MTREALEAALSVPITRESFFNGEMTRASELIEAAARKQLALMPEVCGECEGEGRLSSPTDGYRTMQEPCPVCHGSGKVYKQETVRLIADVLQEWDGCNFGKVAIAVLDAINGLDQEAPK